MKIYFGSIFLDEYPDFVFHQEGNFFNTLIGVSLNREKDGAVYTTPVYLPVLHMERSPGHFDMEIFVSPNQCLAFEFQTGFPFVTVKLHQTKVTFEKDNKPK